MWNYHTHFTDEKAEVPGGGSALPKVTEQVRGGAVLIPGLSLPCAAHETEPVLLSLAPEAPGDLAPAPLPRFIPLLAPLCSSLSKCLIIPQTGSDLSQPLSFASLRQAAWWTPAHPSSIPPTVAVTDADTMNFHCCCCHYCTDHFAD